MELARQLRSGLPCGRCWPHTSLLVYLFSCLVQQCWVWLVISSAVW